MQETRAIDILWKGEQLYLVGNAITTQERFARFSESIAHIYEDGHISRFGINVGDVSEITTLDGKPVKYKPEVPFEDVLKEMRSYIDKLIEHYELPNPNAKPN